MRACSLRKHRPQKAFIRANQSQALEDGESARASGDGRAGTVMRILRRLTMRMTPMRLGTLFAGASCLLLLAQAAPAAAGYGAIAAGSRGSSTVGGYDTMEGARDAAVAACRARWGTSCSISTAEDDSWFFSAGLCDGEAYTAASPSPMRAEELVRAKGYADGRSSCRIFATQQARNR
jgi:hypothetical protein